MKKIIFILLGVFAINSLQAQKSANELVTELNKIITLYSSDNASSFRLLEVTGSLEQKITDANSQRIKLNEISEVNLNANQEANNVTIHCNDQVGCINIIKRDLSSSPSNAAAFFFVDIKSATLFAKTFIQLIDKFSTDHHTVKTNVPATSEVEITSSKPQEKAPVAETKPIKTETKPVKSNLEIDTDENEVETQKPSRNRKEVRNEDEDEDPKPRATSKKPVKENVDEDEVETSKSKPSKPQRQTKKKEENEDENEQADNNDAPPVRTPMEADRSEEPVDAVCKQLMNIIQAGKRSGFKEIEGALTNPEKKINESRIKLKGAKRSYLSWYKNQRAFIAEFKTLADHDLIVEEFLKLQTSLEDCIQGGWDDTDHSGDDIYANETEEVKDVEYKNTLDNSSPSFRIMISGNANKQYTLFVRIQ